MMTTNKVRACAFSTSSLFILLMGAASILSAQEGSSLLQSQIGAARDPNGSAIRVLPVRGRVYMLVGAGGNITVQVGDENLFVVDTGSPQMSAEVLAAIRTISSKPILFIADTSADEDHVGGNASDLESRLGPPRRERRRQPTWDFPFHPGQRSSPISMC